MPVQGQVLLAVRAHLEDRGLSGIDGGGQTLRQNLWVEMRELQVDVVLQPSLDDGLYHVRPATFDDTQIVFPKVPILRPTPTP